MYRSWKGAPASAGRGSTPQRKQRSRLARGAALSVLSCAVGAAGLTAPAGAAVNQTHTLFVLKDDSIIEVEGFASRENVLVQVKRNGIVVGSVEGPASLDGTFIINHDFCWDDVTPQILPGDVVEASDSAGLIGTTTVADVHVTQGPVLDGNRFTIKGRVHGPRVPVGELMAEARTNDPIRFRPIAPNADAEDGPLATIRYDRATGGAFTATFTGLDPAERQAVGNLGEFFVSHAPAANEITMATEASPAPGPGCGQDAPLAMRAVTGTSVPSVNAHNLAQGLTVRGTTHNSSRVTVRLTDDDAATTGAAPVVDADLGAADARGRATWSATFGEEQLRGLNGTITMTATHVDSLTSTPLRGVNATIEKDTAVPARPSATPSRGTFRRPQRVTLTAEAGAQIRYTLGDGNQAAPTASTGLRYARPVPITASQTLKAVAVDAAGNVSAARRAVYRIGAPPSKPRIRAAASGRAAGVASAVARWRPPLVTNGSRVTGYRVTALRLRRNGSVSSRSTSALLRPGARAHDMRLRRGTYRFAVRAFNAFGGSALSARSNAVTSR